MHVPCVFVTLKQCVFAGTIINTGAKGDWDFRISDLVKNPDGIDILPLLTSMPVPLESFQIF